ncbi:MAG: hypothetical protein K0S34_215 [Bacillales bacterium]|jgi:hypothetical protein|nr:hypothetical protein [Bacillales bacterium]
MKDMHAEGFTLINNDNNKKLPFCLELLVGKGVKAKQIYINKLWTELDLFTGELIQIQEYRSIKVFLHSRKDLKVRINWDKLEGKYGQNRPNSYLLSKNIEKVVIFEQGVTEENYPWNCGIYSMEIIFEGHSYWTYFQIIPKNITTIQLQDIHELIHEHVNGLSHQFQSNILKVNSTCSEFEEEILSLYNKILSEEKMFKNKLDRILNRREEKDCGNISNLINYIDDRISSLQYKLNKLKAAKINFVKENKNIEFLFDASSRSLIKINKIKKLLQHFNLHLNFNNKFKKDISTTKIRTLSKHTTKFKVNYSRTNSPYKETYLLYEYYCYFLILNILLELKFQFDKVNNDTINSIIKLNVLPEPTYITVVKGDLIARLVYNDVIEHYKFGDEIKNEGLISLEEKRKPDIRIDMYTKKNNVLEYQQSIIFEVKYSPIYNIYQNTSYTKAMDQLKKYWTLKYIKARRGYDNQFIRNPIKEVLCLYPGSKSHNNILQSPIALFIQAFPIRTKQNKTIHVGKKELKELIRNSFKSLEKSL